MGTVGSAAEHWEALYASRSIAQLSWHQQHAGTGLRLITDATDATAAVIDVGAGASSLAEDLLDAGYRDVTVLDVSQHALAVVRGRLGDRAGLTLVVADLLAWQPDRTYDVWHDRAVFHFLTDAADRDRYITIAARAVAPGGVLVLGTFAADGPHTCSGLPTARYDADSLAALFAGGFTVRSSERQVHRTPGGAEQPFTWVVLVRTS